MDADLLTFYMLSWMILEAKLQYYHPELVHKSHGSDYVLSDQEYDAIEADYKALAKTLGFNPTASNCVGFPMDTPSGQLVLDKLRNKKGRNL